MTTTARKMLKIVCPIERKDGTTHWLRVGTAFPNRDNSINLYIDAFPTNNGKLQLREVDESDLRSRDGDGPRVRSRGSDGGAPGSAAPAEDLPF